MANNDKTAKAVEAKGAKLMEVKAIAVGYHQALKEPGDVFSIEDNAENRKASWFKPVDSKGNIEETDAI